MSSFVKASGGITPNSADPGEEFPFLHTITVVDRVVSVDKPELVQNNIKTETVTLNLDSEWEGLSTVINIGNEKPVSVIWSGEPVVIPAELMTTVGSLDVSVVGYGDDGGIRAVTKKATSIFNVVASGFVEGDEAVPDPTTILGQLTEAADRANQAADRFNQASEDIGDISDAVTEVEGYAGAAKTSETNAASSATAASRSETNAAASASAAKVSETNAAASATAAQQAVDGFGLEVGTTTTGDPGTDAAVEIQKAGTKYTASFTIPRGDVGPAGVNENVPLGSTSGVVAQGTDAYPTLPRKVQAHGRTIENLWVTYDQATNDGVTIDTDDTGLITVTGNASTDTEITFYRTIEANPGDKFTVRASVDTNNTTGKLKIQCENKNGSYFSVDASTTPKTFTIPEGNSGLSLLIRIPYDASLPSGVRYQFYVMLVRGSEAPVAFVPSGVNTVKPTELVAAGKNFLSYPAVDNSQFDGALTFKNEANGPVKIHVDMATNYQGYFYNVPGIHIPAGTYTFSYGDNVITGLQMAVKFSDGSKFEISSWETISKKTFTLTGPKTIVQFYIQLKNSEKMGDFTMYPMLELSSTKSDWEACETVETELPSGISLANGDTLAIDRDGTTQIVHAEGEPTVLENVALPELPSPMFNVYTTGGYIQPTVDVDYEQDVNLALDREIPHDATLVGNGTKSSPLGVGDLSSRYTPTTTTTALDTRVKALEMIDGTFINPISKSGDDADADSIAYGKIYIVNNNWKNIPGKFIGGYLFYGISGSAHFQLLFGYSDDGGEAVYIRQGWTSIGRRPWRRLVKAIEYQALETRVQALEAKLSDQ